LPQRPGNASIEPVDLDLSGRPRNDPLPGYARRLRPVRRLCAGLAGAVALFAVLSWLLVRRSGAVPGAPPALPLALSLFAALLILLSSRVHWTIVRRAFPRLPVLPVDPAAVLAAYSRASLISFALLEIAGLLGLLVALTSGSVAYGVVLCLVSLIAMLTRWPRATEADRILRGRLR
jgi:hypothetical protein